MMKNFQRIIGTIMVFVLCITLGSTLVKTDVSADSDKKEQASTVLRKYDLTTGETSLVPMESDKLFRSDSTSNNTQGYNPSKANPYAIIGTDERTKVTTTTTHPYYAIAQLSVTYTDSTSATATGFMVSENVLLTAGHASMSESSNAPIKSATIYLGRNGSSTPSTATLSSYYVCSEFTYYSDDDQDDYAIWILNSNIGNTSGWFGVGYNTSNSYFTGNTFTITGYPGDKPNGTMWTASASISSCSTYLLKHKIDTMAGQSGAPVYINKSGSGYVVYGIQVSGTSTMNTARRITQELYDWLIANNYIH